MIIDVCGHDKASSLKQTIFSLDKPAYLPINIVKDSAIIGVFI